MTRHPFLFAAHALVWVCTHAGAQDAPPLGLSGTLGAGAMNIPTYEGSPNRRSVVVPDLSLVYRTESAGTVEMGPRGLIWNLLGDRPGKLGLVGAYDPGRKTKKTSAGDPTPGDRRLAGMGDVRSTAEAGVLVGYGPLSAMYRRALGDRGHRGAQLDLLAEWPMELAERVGLRLTAGATWADTRYQQATFGVTAVQSGASGFKVFTPRSGLRKVDLGVGVEYRFADQWKLQSSFGWTQLTGDAADSPIVSDKGGATAYAGIVHGF